VLYGIGTDVAIALIVAALAFVVGSTVGLVCGYLGGWIDDVVMRVADIAMSFPAFDEPTASVDMSSRRALLALLKRLQSEPGLDPGNRGRPRARASRYAPFTPSGGCAFAPREVGSQVRGPLLAGHGGLADSGSPVG
jgi:hypothetical protein